VKVAQAGQLVLDAGLSAPPASGIRIQDAGERPPAPPDGAVLIQKGLPEEYSLSQNYPNPFNPWTRINYTLPASGRVILKVYNLLGQEVAELIDEVQDAGYKSASFDASGIPSGVYTYKLTAGGFSEVRKMLLVK
jgi:hypothetical protein